MSDESDGSTSLSGCVYFDENNNGVMETTDWGIVGAKLSLTLSGSGDSPVIKYTNSTGSYTFDNLSPGTYSITLLSPFPDPGVLTLGQLYDAGGHPVADAGKVADDGFYDIVLKDGYQGINYVFCESIYPACVVSKRLLINGGPKHAPEPSTLVLLAIAGLVLGGYARRGMK